MLKRFVFLLLFLLMVLCAFPASADRYAPYEFDLTYIPKYGEGSFIRGTVYSRGEICREDGLVVKLFLQVEGSDHWWPKPWYDQPYVELNWDSSTFAIPFNTGGNDVYAKNIVLMLVREEDANLLSFDEADAAALCVSTIRRLPDGEITLSHSSRAEAPYLDEIGMDIGFYSGPGLSPGSELPVTLIQKTLRAAAPYTTDIRFYAASGEIAKAYPIAQEMGFRVAATAWLEDSGQDPVELASLVSLCNDGMVSVAIVGNESVHSQRLTFSELMEDIAEVRAGITRPGIPVTTAETPDTWLNHPELIEACDVLAVNIYPFWNVCMNGLAPEDAEKDFCATLDALIGIAGSKPVLITETGWPTAGAEHTGDAEQLDAYRLADDILWKYHDHVSQIYWFALADEPWKTAEEDSVGAHWGILDENLDLKPIVNTVYWSWNTPNDFATELDEDYFW